MKIGDMVKSKDLSVEVLACGSGTYDKAMIYSLDPFKLISEEGDMIWETDVHQEHFEVVGRADLKTLEKAIWRLAKEQGVELTAVYP